MYKQILKINESLAIRHEIIYMCLINVRSYIPKSIEDLVTSHKQVES